MFELKSQITNTLIFVFCFYEIEKLWSFNMWILTFSLPCATIVVVQGPKWRIPIKFFFAEMPCAITNYFCPPLPPFIAKNPPRNLFWLKKIQFGSFHRFAVNAMILATLFKKSLFHNTSALSISASWSAWQRKGCSLCFGLPSTL